MEGSIANLLAKALHSPKSLRTKDGSDALVLSLHCLMVESGFTTLDHKNKPIKGYAPPSDWRQHPFEWIISYTRFDAAAPFVLRCSLQEATGRLFIHASETGPDNLPRRENIQVLGLQLANYTSAEKCSSKSWDGVIQNERTLTEMFREFVSGPLWETAEKISGDNDTGDGEGSTSSRLTTPRTNVSTSGVGTSTAASPVKLSQQENGNEGVVVASRGVVSRKTVVLVAASVTGIAAGVLLYKNYTKGATGDGDGGGRKVPAIFDPLSKFFSSLKSSN